MPTPITITKQYLNLRIQQNPAIDTAIDKDLLYATGEVVVAKTPQNQQDTYNVAITFQHKVAQVSVKVDASILAEYATINSFKASFAQNNYLKKALLILREVA